MRRESRHLLLIVVLLTFAALACGSDRSVAGDGSLLLLVTSELAIPQEIDRLSVEASQGDETVLSEQRDLADQAPPLAATFVLRAQATREPVLIKVVAYHGSAPRIERSARVTVPRARVTELSLALGLSCAGTARVRGGEIVSTCPEGETCVRGSCQSQLISDSDLNVSQSASAAKSEPDPVQQALDAAAPAPAPATCAGAVTQPCGKCGTQTRRCDTVTGTWSDWSACALAAELECGGRADAGASCSPGSFSARGDAGGCIPWKTCSAGQYVAEEGSATRDRTCMDCRQGTFSMLPNSSACVTHERCPPGTRQGAAGSARTPVVCAACSAGQYCDGRAQVSCSDETWDHDHDPATPCVAWRDCEPGSYVEADGSASTDRLCAPCPIQTFSEGSNASHCLSSEACAAGTVQIAAATPASNVVCSVCSPGYYCAGGTATRERCANGTWDHDQNPASTCVPWRPCDGMFVGEFGTAVSDNVCACGPGQHVLVPARPGVNPTCAACDGTTFNPPGSLDAEACLSCPDGTRPNAEHDACL